MNSKSKGILILPIILLIVYQCKAVIILKNSIVDPSYLCASKEDCKYVCPQGYYLTIINDKTMCMSTCGDGIVA